jgi:hypothetical protein
VQVARVIASNTGWRKVVLVRCGSALQSRLRVYIALLRQLRRGDVVLIVTASVVSTPQFIQRLVEQSHESPLLFGIFVECAEFAARHARPEGGA